MSTITITYGSGSTVTLDIPSDSSYVEYVRSIVDGGGAWFTDTSNNSTLTWIPLGQITKITAQ